MEAHEIKNPRTRFAPSPTGFLHIGSVRTALYNYLFAKKYGGKFILRVEDTDIARSKPEFEADILAGMKWLGLDWDEGPDNGGDYGPYRQSERREIYKKYTEKLLNEGKAYYCFCSKDELEAKKNSQMEQGIQPKYDGKCSNLSKAQVEENLAKGLPCVIRFKTEPKHVIFNDLIRGRVEFDTSLFGDTVIATNVETPLYNLACVIDDYEMKITHVIRGEDHIPNTPKQIQLQEALGFPHITFAHMPMILGPDRAKLSKRHNAEPVNFYYQQGYLAEAINNFIVFLGWNPGDEREMFTIEELCKEFSIERVRPSGAIFNVQKLNWFNGIYIRNKSLAELATLLKPFLAKAGLPQNGMPDNPEYLEKAISLYKERLITLGEFADIADYLFKSDISFEKEMLLWKEMTAETVMLALSEAEKVLANVENWSKENIETTVLKYLEGSDALIKARGEMLWPLRVALTGKKASAGPFEVASVLGKDLTLQRIKSAQNLWK
jgi:glutamyl-tRNA synthetase